MEEGICSSTRDNTYLYRFAVLAGLYSEAEEFD